MGKTILCEGWMKREGNMALAAFCQAVRSQWQTLTQLVWPDSPQQQARDEIQHLTEELVGRYRRLVQRRSKIERLRERLAAAQRRVETLSGLASSGTAAEGAWEMALTLERLHRAVQRNRARLVRLEEAYERRRLCFERKKQLRLALARGEVVVVPPGDPLEG
jgi:hypothetical protein